MTTGRRRGALVVNTAARSGRRSCARARRLLEEIGVPIAECLAVADPTRLREAVSAAVDRGADLIVLGGGDGTVSAAVDALAGTGVVLGLLPVGTANDFARTLGIPTDLGRACETIARGEVVDVDLGLAGADYFVNVASVGLAAGAARALSPGLKRSVGALAYPAAAVHALLRHETFEASLRFPAGDHPPVRLGRLLQLAVGNGRYYGGGLAVAPDADIDDRSLDVYAVGLGHPGALLHTLRHLRSGEFVRADWVHHYRTREVRIETKPALPTNVDGELAGRTPVTFGVAPNALRVLVPPGSGAARLDAGGPA